MVFYVSWIDPSCRIGMTDYQSDVSKDGTSWKYSMKILPPPNAGRNVKLACVLYVFCASTQLCQTQPVQSVFILMSQGHSNAPKAGQQHHCPA